MMVRMSIKRPVSDDDVRLDLGEPGRQRRFKVASSATSFSWAYGKNFGFAPRTLQAAVASSRRTSPSGLPKKRRSPRKAVP